MAGQQYSTVSACTMGGSEANAVCESLGTNTAAALIYADIGYAAYSCGMTTQVNTTCGCGYVTTSPMCQAASPPPSPPPPSPPPPSPPPPLPLTSAPFPAGFPFCACTAREPSLSPYSLVTVPASPPSSGAVGRRQILMRPGLVSHARQRKAKPSSAAPVVSPPATSPISSPAAAMYDYITIADSTAPPGGPIPTQPPNLPAAEVLPANATTMMGLESVAMATVGEELCIQVSVGACAISNPCCSTDMYKIELLINSSCWGAVDYAMVNGVEHAVSYASYTSGGGTYTTTKVSDIGFGTPAAASGALVCFQLRSSVSTSCSTVSSFCSVDTPQGVSPSGLCRYAIFNSQQNCCPTASVNEYP